tara:strand:+ start:274 stop:489 length:216 start_codon:yes stop_codon:yes gene_type:complete
MPTEKQWLTVQQYMDIMPLSKPHVYRMIKENQIPHTRVGRRVLIHRKAVEIPGTHAEKSTNADEFYYYPAE